MVKYIFKNVFYLRIFPPHPYGTVRSDALSSLLTPPWFWGILTTPISSPNGKVVPTPFHMNKHRMKQVLTRAAPGIETEKEGTSRFLTDQSYPFYPFSILIQPASCTQSPVPILYVLWCRTIIPTPLRGFLTLIIKVQDCPILPCNLHPWPYSRWGGWSRMSLSWIHLLSSRHGFKWPHLPSFSSLLFWLVSSLGKFCVIKTHFSLFGSDCENLCENLL